MLSSIRELWGFRELIVTLAERDLRIRYKQAVLGIAWAVITPVVMMLAFTLIFTSITSVPKLFPKDYAHEPYVLLSYMGLLPWTFFSSALSQGGLALVSNTPLLNKLYCPREVFPIAAILDCAVDSVIATLVLAVLFPIVGFAPKAQAFYLPVLLIVLLMFTLGITLAVSAIVVYMRDLRLVLPLAVQVGLFATPVVYPVEKILHAKWEQIAYSAINPIAPVIDGMRRAVLLGRPPHWSWLAAGAASSLLVLLGGFWLFKRLETGMADVA